MTAQRRKLTTQQTKLMEVHYADAIPLDLHARLDYAAAGLAEAMPAAFEAGITRRDATGGAIAVTPDGAGALGHTSAMMFAAYRDADGVQIWT